MVMCKESWKHKRLSTIWKIIDYLSKKIDYRLPPQGLCLELGNEGSHQHSSSSVVLPEPKSLAAIVNLIVIMMYLYFCIFRILGFGKSAKEMRDVTNCSVRYSADRKKTGNCLHFNRERGDIIHLKCCDLIVIC